MMDLNPVVARLLESGFTSVRGVIEYSALANAPAQLPADFVVPLADVASANRMSGIIDQRVNLEFQVVSIIAGQAAQPGRASSDLVDHIRQIKAALLGWTIPETSMPIEYSGGRLLSAGGREVVWSTRFKSAYHERTQAQ